MTWPRIARLVSLLLIVTLLVGSSLAYGAVAPFVPGRPRAPPVVSSGCARLTLSHQSTVPSFAGAPADLVYGCGRNGGRPAFSTGHSHGGKPLLLTPTFSLPTGWTLSVGKARLLHECSPRDRMVVLGSGRSTVLQPDTDYVYCLTTTSASSFATFSVTWSG